MQKILAAGAGLLMLIIGHAHAGEIICPAVTDIHRNVESVEDVYAVDPLENRDWKSESLVDVVDPASLRFKGAMYVTHNVEGEESTSSRATVICSYGDINLAQDYRQILEPTFSKWVDKRCESRDPRMCRLMDADYFNVSFEQ